MNIIVVILVQISFLVGVGSSLFESVHPPPPLPRWAATLKFVVPTVAEGPAVSLSGTGKAPWANRLRVPFPHERKLQIPPLRYPGFPVEVDGVGKPHAAFLTESRTRGHWRVQRSRKSGFAPVGMTNLRVAAHLGSGGGGGTEPAQQQPTRFRFARVLFNPFSKLRRSEGRSSANLDSSA